MTKNIDGITIKGTFVDPLLYFTQKQLEQMVSPLSVSTDSNFEFTKGIRFLYQMFVTYCIFNYFIFEDKFDKKQKFLCIYYFQRKNEFVATLDSLPGNLI